jgi:hypothetical protein
LLAERAIEHLLLRMRPINRLLREAVARRTAASRRLPAAPAAPLALAPAEVQELLDDVEALPPWSAGPLDELRSDEVAREEALRRGTSGAMPLDALEQALSLTPFEREAVLLCAAPEVDSAYGRIYGYILDDLGRQEPCVELLCSLSARDALERHARRAALAPWGTLVRHGVVRLGPDAGSEWRRPVRLAPRALELLLGAGGEVRSFRDPAELCEAPGDAVVAGVDPARLERVAAVLRERPAPVVGAFGPLPGEPELPRALAAAAGLPLRRLPWEALAADPRIAAEALHAARCLGALVWIPVEGRGDGDSERRALEAIEDAAGESPPLLLTRRHPVRPLGLLRARPWLELEARRPSFEEAEVLWRAAVPEVADAELGDLAARFRLSAGEISAAARIFRAEQRLGDPRPPLAALASACRTAARRRSERFATVITPSRGAGDLVLPDPLHRAVLDVARFARAWPRVATRWGLGPLHGGAQGVRALFTGPSGTGKTLAAEVIAGELGQDLHRVDLAQVVSKWVGETEKNLEASFDEAEQAQAVLFFDEADALLAKRGEVRHGADRYANLEVSFLLQRLEAHAGLVIVASNLRENIDEAFVRRFHAAVDFPRPAEPERLRLWASALPESVPRNGVDFAALARLDMTGATIVNAARTAALLAADEDTIVSQQHLLEGVAREYRRESRIPMSSAPGAPSPRGRR